MMTRDETNCEEVLFHLHLMNLDVLLDEEGDSEDKNNHEVWRDEEGPQKYRDGSNTSGGNSGDATSA